MNDLPTLEERFAKIRDGGFDGVEIAIPPDGRNLYSTEPARVA